MPPFCRSFPREWRSLSLATAICLLAGCNKPSSGDTQIAATVGKGEISVHQVEEALRRQPALAADQPDTAAKTVLDGLIEQEIAAQAATSEGLDHEPAVVQALELARRETLAKALQDRVAAGVALPTTAEIDQFYADKPALFSQRRIYVLQEFAVNASAASLPSLQQLAQAARTPEELADALRKAPLSFQTRVLPKAPEDMDLSLVNSFAALGEGQSVVLSQPGGVAVYMVLSARPAPVERAAATQAIFSFLLSARRREALGARMKALRGSVKIDYLGSFAKPVAPAASSASAAS